MRDFLVRRLWLGAAILVAMVAARGYCDERARVEDVDFVARCDGSTQKYLVIRPAGFEEDAPHDLLVMLHGHGSDRRQVLDEAVSEFRAGREAAAARNMLVISPDYRAKTSWMGPKAEADLLQILDELKSKYKIGKVVVSGASMGGSSALAFAAMHPELVDGVVSMNGTANHFEFENFQKAIETSFGGTKREIPLEYKKRSAEYWPERLTMPVAISAGGQDETVPPASVRRLADVLKKLNPESVLLLYSDSGGHSTSYDDSKSAYEFVLGKVGEGGG